MPPKKNITPKVSKSNAAPAPGAEELVKAVVFKVGTTCTGSVQINIAAAIEPFMIVPMDQESKTAQGNIWKFGTFADREERSVVLQKFHARGKAVAGFDLKTPIEHEFRLYKAVPLKEEKEVNGQKTLVYKYDNAQRAMEQTEGKQLFTQICISEEVINECCTIEGDTISWTNAKLVGIEVYSSRQEKSYKKDIILQLVSAKASGILAADFSSLTNTITKFYANFK